MDVWVDEVTPAPDESAKIHGTPADLFARIRAGAVPESEQDKFARRHEKDAEIERQARREARENVDVLLARRGEGFSGFADVAVRAIGISRHKIEETGRPTASCAHWARPCTWNESDSRRWSAI
jgi:hypothetical protein